MCSARARIVSAIVNRSEIRFIGMQRSGNHAVINWIARQSRGSMFFLGDVRLFQNPYDGMEELEHFVDGSRVAQITLYNEVERETFKSTVYFDEVIGKFTLKSLLLYNYEDKPLSDICSNAFEQRHDEWLGISERRLDVLLIEIRMLLIGPGLTSPKLSPVLAYPRRGVPQRQAAGPLDLG